MSEQIKTRRSFKEYNPETQAYIAYELYGELPDFTTFTYGSNHSIVLRNKETGGLERIEFTISGDDEKYAHTNRRLWGDIKSDDYHTILVFQFNEGEVEKITASFCGNSMSRKKFAKIVEESPYAAAATNYDLFYRSFPDLKQRNIKVSLKE